MIPWKEPCVVSMLCVVATPYSYKTVKSRDVRCRTNTLSRLRGNANALSKRSPARSTQVRDKTTSLQVRVASRAGALLLEELQPSEQQICLEIALQRWTVLRPALMSRYAVSAARWRRQQASLKACRRTPFPSCQIVCKTVARRAFARSARTLLRASAWGEHASAREQALACWQCFAQVAGQSGARKRRRAGRAVARQASRSTRAGVLKWLAG